MLDETTKIADIKQKIKQFMEDREWQQFHSPKNMSMQIAIEASELMELFLWCDSNQSSTDFESKRKEVEQEVADIAVTLLNFCIRMNIDLATAINEKMEINAQRYPLERAKGNAKKYTEYQEL
jgi:dCTP diphosphatase